MTEALTALGLGVFALVEWLLAAAWAHPLVAALAAIALLVVLRLRSPVHRRRIHRFVGAPGAPTGSAPPVSVRT